MIRILAITTCSLILPRPALAAMDWGPWTAPVKRTPDSSGAPLQPLQIGIRIFQRFISPVDGPRCPMYPTCTAHALEALEKHGPLLGSLMTVDRLLHEGGPAYHTHPLNVGGRIRFLDRLEMNDY
jgi:uncharacterized protein